jgi:hypothetical protein
MMAAGLSSTSKVSDRPRRPSLWIASIGQHVAGTGVKTRHPVEDTLEQFKREKVERRLKSCAGGEETLVGEDEPGKWLSTAAFHDASALP